jgi:hypothetical protein
MSGESDGAAPIGGQRSHDRLERRTDLAAEQRAAGDQVGAAR